MKKWRYFIITGSILTITVIYAQVSSSTGESLTSAAFPSINNTVASNWKMTKEHFVRPSKSELKKQLTNLQYRVTQKDATERPFDNEYWNNKQEGIYVDIVSGEPLFSSIDKFKSGTGWPSFTRPIRPQALTSKKDRKLFYTRTELRSRIADSHLGHVFEDGPAPTGLRYCINSAALRFIPKEELASQGYEEYLSLFDK